MGDVLAGRLRTGYNGMEGSLAGRLKPIELKPHKIAKEKLFTLRMDGTEVLCYNAHRQSNKPLLFGRRCLRTSVWVYKDSCVCSGNWFLKGIFFVVFDRSR